LTERHPSPPSRVSIERHPAENRELLVHVLPCPRAARQFCILEIPSSSAWLARSKASVQALWWA
jgi:hypothetical protein